MWGCLVTTGHQSSADLSVSATHQHLPEGWCFPPFQFPGCSQDCTKLFFKPFPFTDVLGECKSFQQAVLSHGMVTAGRASRLLPSYRKALIPLRCSLSNTCPTLTFEPFLSQPFSGFKASLPVLWGCVGFLWCFVLVLPSLPQLPCLGLGTLLPSSDSQASPCGSVGSVSCPGDLSHFLLLHLSSLSFLHSW